MDQTTTTPDQLPTPTLRTYIKDFKGLSPADANTLMRVELKQLTLKRLADYYQNHEVRDLTPDQMLHLLMDKVDAGHMNAEQYKQFKWVQERIHYVEGELEESEERNVQLNATINTLLGRLRQYNPEEPEPDHQAEQEAAQRLAAQADEQPDEAPNMGKVVFGMLLARAIPHVVPLLTRFFNSDPRPAGPEPEQPAPVASPAAPQSEPTALAAEERFSPPSTGIEMPVYFLNPSGGAHLFGFHCGTYDATTNSPDLKDAATYLELNAGDFFHVKGFRDDIPGSHSQAPQPIKDEDFLVWTGSSNGFCKGVIVGDAANQPPKSTNHP